MFRYLRAAFWAAPDVAGIGWLPVNVIALAGAGVLGVGHPGFWLLGLALETAYLFALTTDERFQRAVDAEAQTLTADAAALQRQALVARLGAPDQERVAGLEAKCAQTLQLHRDSETGEFVVEGNREALQKLSWIYLKLLVARTNLQSIDPARTEEELSRKITRLQNDLRDGTSSPSLLESKQATLRILEQRRKNLERREETLEEIESDLARIEAQVDLALDQAGMRGKSETISANIDLVSQLLDDSVYGDAGASIAQLERAYGRE